MKRGKWGRHPSAHSHTVMEGVGVRWGGGQVCYRGDTRPKKWSENEKGVERRGAEKWYGHEMIGLWRTAPSRQGKVKEGETGGERKG